jgi:xanthine/CO dehydrogenase XdhC/CoxF family maturation factor
VEFAGQLGWHVVVADGRGHLARANRFPQADSVIQLPQFGDPLSALNITQRDAVVLMTHSYEQDRRLLQAVLSSAPRYLGLLGARHRSRLLLRDCAAALGRTVEDYLSQMHVPVGLDLGSDAPESIALSIVAEIQAHLHGRNAGMRTQDDAAEMKLSDDLPQQPIMCQTHLHSNSEEN